MYFFRQDQQDFFRLQRGALSAEGRFILMIPLVLSNFLFKDENPFLFCRVLIFVIRHSLFVILFKSFFSDQIGRLFGGRRRS